MLRDVKRNGGRDQKEKNVGSCGSYGSTLGTGKGQRGSDVASRAPGSIANIPVILSRCDQPTPTPLT